MTAVQVSRPISKHRLLLIVLGRIHHPGWWRLGRSSRARAPEVHCRGRRKLYPLFKYFNAKLKYFIGSLDFIEWYAVDLKHSLVTDERHSAYNAFTRYGRSSSWCKSHALSFRALSRAVSIRSQLKKYMQRFGLPMESCEGDAKRLRRCLVSGYWRNGARWMADGTFRSVRGNRVRSSVLACAVSLFNCAIRYYTFTRPPFCSRANHALVG